MRWELTTSPHGQVCVSKEMSREEVSFWLLALRANSMDDMSTKGYPHAACFDGAKWSRRETPADPFEEVVT
mgnify:CR=1 FL=1